MDLKEIEELAARPNEMIIELKKGRLCPEPDINKYISAIDPEKHEVFDTTKRPDKIVQEDKGTRIEPVSRIAIAFQKLIVKRASSFIFGNPVKLVLRNTTEDESSKTVYNAVCSIMDNVKIDSLNRKIAKAIFSCTEVAELWYPVELEDDEEKLYGIDSSFKLRVRILSPLKGEKLYPYYDDNGDMIAFSREYLVRNGDDKHIFFETYTDKHIYKFDITREPVLLEVSQNVLCKIPIVYGIQEESDFEDVQWMIDRLEKLLSNFADTNDYHGSPTIFIKGGIKGLSKKGESGKIIEGEKDSEASYLSWSQAPESIKLEIDTLINLIYTVSQTPNITFDNVKGLGSSISAKALKMLFLDAHLKVQDHMEVFDDYLQRRMSIVRNFIGVFNKKYANVVKTVSIDSEVTPYMIDDESDRLELIMTANGNKPVLSQKTSTTLAGFSVDSDSEYNQIKSEDSVSNSLEVLPFSR